MPKSDPVRLRHMLDAAREAMAFTAGKGREDLKADRMLSLACVRLLEVVGEAASQVSPDFRRQHPEVPWAHIVGMRNRLIHAYFDIDQDVLWETLSGDLPALVPVLERILQEGRD